MGEDFLDVSDQFLTDSQQSVRDMRPSPSYTNETFTSDERVVLQHFFTNVDGPVFALKNLPEVVKGALFARYSRSPKSLRRLFLDEFITDHTFKIAAEFHEVGLDRATDLFQRVFYEYGDDSVAQLGGAHVACEQVSNILTKVLEWGRLASYLEQSTRYILFDQKFGNRYRYVVPPELWGTSSADTFTSFMDSLFDLYSSMAGRLRNEYEQRLPRNSTDSPVVRKQTIRARVCDDLRGLLPAATMSNLGIYASGQAFEALLIRMRSSLLREVRDYSDLLLLELKKVIPDFVRRVEIPNRGVEWSRYLESTYTETGRLTADLLKHAAIPKENLEEVSLVDWDPEGELKIIASALYRFSSLSDSHLLALVRQMTSEEREHIFWTYVGQRGNRRHKPGRALERASYRFDIISDYGTFRDLQRHRMLTIEWQRLQPGIGYTIPDIIEEVGEGQNWHSAMERAATLYNILEESFGPDVAQYVVPFAYRLRFYMQLNAREALHLLELRSQKNGHESYRRVCGEMHRQIAERAGHRLVSAMMKYVDDKDYDFGRLESEQTADDRRKLICGS